MLKGFNALVITASGKMFVLKPKRFIVRLLNVMTLSCVLGLDIEGFIVLIVSRAWRHGVWARGIEEG
jgi:hypothetical protein